MKQVIYPPTRRLADPLNVSVFLAGSIDMGSARDWQTDLINRFHDHEDLSFYNPRRPEGFAGKQSLENDMFVEQVNWEIDNLRTADIVVMYITASSQAPISLLEFGYCMGHDKIKNIVVAVEPGYWRRGNIEVMCNRYSIPLFEDLDDAEENLRSHIKERARKTFF
jgi:hypothetical protein